MKGWICSYENIVKLSSWGSLPRFATVWVLPGYTFSEPCCGFDCVQRDYYLCNVKNWHEFLKYICKTFLKCLSSFSHPCPPFFFKTRDVELVPYNSFIFLPVVSFSYFLLVEANNWMVSFLFILFFFLSGISRFQPLKSCTVKSEYRKVIRKQRKEVWMMFNLLHSITNRSARKMWEGEEDKNNEILLKHILLVFGGKRGRKFYLLRIWEWLGNF